MSGIVKKYEMETVGKEKADAVLEELSQWMTDNEVRYLAEWSGKKQTACLQNRVAIMAAIRACETKNAHARGLKNEISAS